MPATPAPILDISRLERQSMGDPRMKVELLALFMLELERLMTQASTELDAVARSDRLQAIGTLAHGIGAVRLAHAARAASSELGTAGSDLTPLAEAVAETLALVRSSAL